MRKRQLLCRLWSFFGNSFFDTPMSTLMGRMLESPFDDFFSDMPALMAAPAAQRAESEKTETTPAQDAEPNQYDQRRRLNALKLEMNRAIQEENFERAAEIRDELRRMEQQSNTNTDEQK